MLQHNFGKKLKWLPDDEIILYMKYVEVELGVDKHWNNYSYTYSTEEELSPGQIIRVPFGPKKKPGLVRKYVAKPDFAVKNIMQSTDIILSQETLSFNEWFKQFYCLSGGESLSMMLPSFMTTYRKTLGSYARGALTNPSLNSQQKQAVKNISATTTPTVLQGITGSGKTRVYIDLIVAALKTAKMPCFFIQR